MNAKKNRRKVYLINPRFQYSFIIFSMTVGLLSLCVFYFAILYFFWTFEQRGLSLGIPIDHIFFRYIQEERQYMNFIFSIASVLVLIITSIGALILSHKVAGPLHQLNEMLNKMINQKKFMPVKFREGDFFMELEVSINKLLSENLTNSELDSKKNE